MADTASITFAVIIGIGYFALAIFSLIALISYIKKRSNFKDRNKPPLWITFGIILTSIGKHNLLVVITKNLSTGRCVNVGLTSEVSFEAVNEYQYVHFFCSLSHCAGESMMQYYFLLFLS
jgi:hypothetical protein